MNRNQLTKAQRRKRRKIKRMITTVVCVILAVLITLLCVRIRTLRAFRGDYVRRIDVTDRVVASTALWLKDVEGADVTEEWIRSKTDGIDIAVILSFDPSGPHKGTFSEEVDASDYASCREESLALVCDCLRELIIKRLSMIGYGESITDDEADDLTEQALGMPLRDYLDGIGVNTAPDFDTLEEETGRSGEYRIKGNTISGEWEGGSVTESFSVGKNVLTMHDKSLVYTRVEEPGDEEGDTTGLLRPLTVHAATLMPENVSVSVDGMEPGTVRAINASYNNNLYVSLRDMAYLFAGSSRPFNADITGGSVAIMTGEGYTDEYGHDGFSQEELKQYPGSEPSGTVILVNGQERRYFVLVSQIEDHYDCFISPMDLAMILDVDMDTADADNITIDTGKRFSINPARMEGYGYFDGFNTVVVGDATTGEVFYGYDYEKAFPIASTTKLMTYLLTMDAVGSGKIGLEDPVTISAKAAALSGSQDGFVALEAGWQVPVSELILGALLPSSNECALALAEYVGGSEDEFVNMMNDKARALGLNSASFHNPNGLPIYTDTIIPAKTQNMMSGYDMFKMCAHILNTYPQVKEITSLKTAKMPTLKRELKNTNALLYNMDEVNGLKTGTTDKSGACLITSLTVNDGGTDHDIVVVALGAENSQARLRVSELMARYGKDVVQGRAARISYSINGSDEENESLITAEDIIRKVIDHALLTFR